MPIVMTKSISFNHFGLILYLNHGSLMKKDLMPVFHVDYQHSQ